MAKEQEFMELFPKHDSDNDGEINKDEFIALANEIGVPSLYPGSVSNMIRKLNYASPNKETINLEQAKQYILSFESPPKHDIWKSKYALIAAAAEIRGEINGSSSQAAAPAAPGAPTADSFKDEPETTPKQAKINLLVGPPKASYNSQVEINIEKVQLQNKPKPFVKLTFTSQTNERAKTIQTVFKQNFQTFLSLIAQDIEEWTDQLKNFHINSMVNDTTTTFFFTTVNEDIVDYIKVLAEMFELTFNYQLQANAHVKLEFDYDFQKFVDEPQSHFYDIFTKDFKLEIDAKALNFLKALKKLGAKSEMSNDIFYSSDIVENLFPISLLHLEEVDADLEFENSDIVDYETETKEELIEGLKGLGQFFQKLNEGGMHVYELLELIDGNVTVEGTAGEWKAKLFLRLKNINQIFIKYTKIDIPLDENNNVEGNANPPIDANNSDSELSQNSSKGVKKLSQKKTKKKVETSGAPQASDDEDSESGNSVNSNSSQKLKKETVNVQLIKKQEDNLSNASSDSV